MYTEAKKIKNVFLDLCNPPGYPHGILFIDIIYHSKFDKEHLIWYLYLRYNNPSKI